MFTKVYELIEANKELKTIKNKVIQISRENNIDINKYISTIKHIRLTLLSKEHSDLMSRGFKSSNGITIDCKHSDMANWMMLVSQRQLLDDTDSDITICDYNNVIQTMPYIEFVNMINELSTYYSNIYNKKWVIRDRITQMTKVSQILDTSF